MKEKTTALSNSTRETSLTTTANGKPSSAKTRAGLSLYDIEAAEHCLIGKDTPFNTDVLELIDRLTDLDTQVETGVDTLASQAEVLDSLFHFLLKRTLLSTETKHIEMWMKFALRAQAQSRCTYEAMSDIKNPRITNSGSGQVNVATGHQQVNNDTGS